MRRLAGQSSTLVFLLMITVSFISSCKRSADTYRQICIGDNYFLTNVTPTIQTVAKVESMEYGGKVSLVRGCIEFMAINSQVIVGYLSVRFFKEDDLIGLAGDHDKEGFFIIRKEDEYVESGLDGQSFFNKLEKKYHQKEINFLKPKEIREVGECKTP